MYLFNIFAIVLRNLRGFSKEQTTIDTTNSHFTQQNVYQLFETQKQQAFNQKKCTPKQKLVSQIPSLPFPFQILILYIRHPTPHRSPSLVPSKVPLRLLEPPHNVLVELDLRPDKVPHRVLQVRVPLGPEMRHLRQHRVRHHVHAPVDLRQLTIFHLLLRG